MRNAQAHEGFDRWRLHTAREPVSADVPDRSIPNTKQNDRAGHSPRMGAILRDRGGNAFGGLGHPAKIHRESNPFNRRAYSRERWGVVVWVWVISFGY